MELNGSRILITGGSLGIGKATAKLFVAAGAKVAITGRDKARVEAAAAETGAFPITADVASTDDISRTYDEFLDKCGGLDCLINNAGIGKFGPMGTLAMSDFESIFNVNVFGAAMMAQRAVEIFDRQGKGNIVNIGSTAAEKGFANGTVYSASKFALRGMTQCWQAELRPRNIRVFLVDPSEVATAFANEARDERVAPPNKLTSDEIAHAIKAVLEMDDRGMIPELSIWATNSW